MQQPIEIALIVNLVALGIAVISQFVTINQTNKTLAHQRQQTESERQLRMTEAELGRQETKRIEWKNYLIQLMGRLIEAREDYERFLGTDKKDSEKHAGIVGKAIAVCLAVDDTQMAKYATDDLTPYFADKRQDDGTVELDWASRNRNALHAATLQLAEIIRKT